MAQFGVPESPRDTAGQEPESKSGEGEFGTIDNAKEIHQNAKLDSAAQLSTKSVQTASKPAAPISAAHSSAAAHTSTTTSAAAHASAANMSAAHTSAAPVPVDSVALRQLAASLSKSVKEFRQKFPIKEVSPIKQRSAKDSKRTAKNSRKSEKVLECSRCNNFALSRFKALPEIVNFE
eukprot:267711_1